MSNKVLSAFLFDGEDYDFQDHFEITGAPEDCDWTRWAMLGDDDDYRLYCFKQGSVDTIYQFAFNDEEGDDYEYGYNSSETVKLIGKPETANTTTFAMLHDGKDYRMYFLDVNDFTLLHQMVYEEDSHSYVVDETNPTVRLTGMPKDIDPRRIAMCAEPYKTHERKAAFGKGGFGGPSKGGFGGPNKGGFGSPSKGGFGGPNKGGFGSPKNTDLVDKADYYCYLFKQGSSTELYCAYYNPTTKAYEYEEDCPIETKGINIDPTAFAALNIGDDFWMYFLKSE